MLAAGRKYRHGNAEYWSKKDAERRRRYAHDPEYRAKVTVTRNEKRGWKARGDLTAAAWLQILAGADCAYCGAAEQLTQEHVIPRERGGAHAASNVVAACLSCNCSKRDRLLAEWLTSPSFPERARARVEALVAAGIGQPPEQGEQAS